jgi:hypothetical protein
MCITLCSTPSTSLYTLPNLPVQYKKWSVLSCPLVSIPHPLPRPKRVGIQIPLASSYSPAPPSLLPTLLTNPLHLIPSVTWLGYLDGPVLWLAIYLFIILPCLALSPLVKIKRTIYSSFYIYVTIIKLINHLYPCTSQ